MDLNERNARVVEEFRANGGAVGGPWEGATMLLLHTKGATSGLPRVNPLVYLPDGERYVIVGSKGGASETRRRKLQCLNAYTCRLDVIDSPSQHL